MPSLVRPTLGSRPLSLVSRLLPYRYRDCLCVVRVRPDAAPAVCASLRPMLALYTRAASRRGDYYKLNARSHVEYIACRRRFAESKRKSIVPYPVQHERSSRRVEAFREESCP
ncbi:hypothetical protein WOLCODRAFT_137163 [Wolfiporia cocos MD-104 SS10]|uniref:Uncharacterized protein n=1 Tax=Wolfiporia cocos (strain MD-104) TaxID=742152 RepID=A0A2H3JTA7_WOLCO|nr:hypothetical protein WOLCODRAFT_137163 [Wolfiporia cocos MD-104 SS10]